MSRHLRFKYQTIEFGKIDIHIRSLRDNQQFQDINGLAKSLGIHSSTWPLFGLIWPMSETLANYMLTYDIKDLRILEVGCGLGLASLILNKRNADITSTDYHPEAQSFLEFNTSLNQDKSIPFILADWAGEASEMGRFDLIIGSDLLYEPNHAEILTSFIQRHSKPHCTVIIADPGRGNTSKFSTKMRSYGYDISSFSASDYHEDSNWPGKVYTYTR